MNALSFLLKMILIVIRQVLTLLSSGNIEEAKSKLKALETTLKESDKDHE